jgi:hypothetical protein
MFEAILTEEGQFRYRKVPISLANQNRIIRMRFLECDMVTFGVFLIYKPVDPDIFAVEEKYDWSKVCFPNYLLFGWEINILLSLNWSLY